MPGPRPVAVGSIRTQSKEGRSAMFSKILYPTDFSEVAGKALRFVQQLKAAGGAEVVILHVINQRIVNGLLRHATSDREIKLWCQKAEEIARQSMAEMGDQLESLGYSVKSIVRTGFPWREILSVEKEEKPSVIVIGSHGRSNFGDMFLGSVSDRVIRQCQCPVMVVKRDEYV
jgi:nucleotide-binding universal stress UspA family protein